MRCEGDIPDYSIGKARVGLGRGTHGTPCATTSLALDDEQIEFGFCKMQDRH